MIIDKLNRILASQGAERKKLVKELQEEIWNSEARPSDPISEILSELAYDLDFYEPDDNLRSEDGSYYSDDKLEIEISAALEDWKRSGNSESD